jgi:pilus assembly protein CpaF
MSFELILPFLRPIEPLLLDESVSEIMGNPDASWFYERDGILCQEPNISFDAGRLRTGLEVIANQLGKKLDEDNPLLDAHLPDGSRLAAVIPPVVCPAPSLTIRKFTSRHYTVDDLIARGTLTRPLADFLAEQIRSGKTLLISGGTGTGKTTLLRILADFIPDQERLVVIEDTSELQIRKPNIVAAECQTDTFKANISFDKLLKSALRWRPDRIIMGEVRGIEARTLLDSSTPATPDRSRRSTPTRQPRPSRASPIWSCATTRKPPSPTPKLRSEKPSILSSMSSVDHRTASSEKSWRFAGTTAMPNAS